MTDAYEAELNLKVGSTNYQGLAYVTKLWDDFLLWFDFLLATKCNIFISESCLRLRGEQGERIPAFLRELKIETFK